VFEHVLDVGVPRAGATCDEDWFDPSWEERVPGPVETGQVPAADCAPSGWTALELDHGTVDPARLSDADLIDTIVGFERVATWAGARQARLMAEFARRRPGQDCPPDRSDVPGRGTGYAPDEIALALRLSRTTAANRVAMAGVLAAELPATLAAWQAGIIDTRKAQAITETSYVLSGEQRAELEARVLPRAGTQTLAQLRAALARAVLAIDPDGAAARFRARRQDRRVVVCPDEEGMASLWALLSAPDATAAYQRLGQLARGLGADDPRGMDARRADLLVDLLTGRRCAATGTPPDNHPDNHPNDHSNDHGHDDHSDNHDDHGHGHDDAHRDRPGDGAPPDTSGTTPAKRGATETGHDCTTARGTGGRPGKPLVSVIVPITMLLGLDNQPGELVGYGPIPADLAREIAADGTWRRLLTDPTSGTLLDYGRTTYTPPAGLADFVRARDLHCRHPICRQRAATADLPTHPTPRPPRAPHPTVLPPTQPATTHPKTTSPLLIRYAPGPSSCMRFRASSEPVGLCGGGSSDGLT
jgi:hypothetical protein